VRSGDGSEARGRNGAFTGAPVTLAIILANLAIFAAEVIASGSLSTLSDVPREVALRFGANYAPLTVGLGQYERLIACCFLHGSLLHVAVNMWSLGQIGPFAERTVGSARYSVLYVVTGIAGSVMSIFWGLLRGNVPLSVGASGAICGVMGAALVLGVRLEGWRSGIARQIGFWLLVIVAYGARAAAIDNAAHVGGMAVGCIIAALWRRGIQYSKAATVVSVGLSAAVCLASGAIVFWRDATDPFAQYGANERSLQVIEALQERDCPQARRLFAATEKAARHATPELEGLRSEVDRKCPAQQAK
jgi:rhomboid protease GluP